MATPLPEQSEFALAEAVKSRRRSLGMSQVRCANDAGISRRAWMEIENGHRRGSDETLARMDGVLQLPPGSLASLKAKPPRDTGLAEIRRELIQMVKLLTRDEMEQVRLDITRRRFEALRAQLERYDGADANTPSQNGTSG